MKKKTMLQKTMMLTMTAAMVTMLFAGCFILSNAKEPCGKYHQLVWADDGIKFVRLYTHSHYKEKNGRLDYWPCIVYDRRQYYKKHCLNCGYIDEYDYRSLEVVHEDAY